MPAVSPVGYIGVFPEGRTSDGASRSWRCPLHNPSPDLFKLFAIAEVDELIEGGRKHFEWDTTGSSGICGEDKPVCTLRKQGIELSFSPLKKDAMGRSPSDLQIGDPTFD